MNVNIMSNIRVSPKTGVFTVFPCEILPSLDLAIFRHSLWQVLSILSIADSRRSLLFITMIVHLCVQHDGRNQSVTWLRLRLTNLALIGGVGWVYRSLPNWTKSAKNAVIRPWRETQYTDSDMIQYARVYHGLTV